MTLRAHTTRRFNVILALTLGAAASLAGPSACKPAASDGAAVAYPPQKPLQAYQADPAWRHRVGLIDLRPAAPAAAPAPGGAAPAAAPELGALLEQAGFSVARLGGAPPDGGEYNAIVEIGQPGGRLVVGARILAPDAKGSYELVAPETDNDLFVRVVASLTQVLQPTPPPPPAAEEPPPPDPKVVCNEECAAKQVPCARACCEKGLGSDAAKCDTARDMATRCLSECADKAKDEADEAKKAKKIAGCEDGCRRGKHGSYSWDTKNARTGSVWAKCVPGCAEEHTACVAACDAPPAAEEPAVAPTPTPPAQ